jgi:hypothetical protein
MVAWSYCLGPVVAKNTMSTSQWEYVVEESAYLMVAKIQETYTMRKNQSPNISFRGMPPIS